MTDRPFCLLNDAKALRRLTRETSCDGWLEHPRLNGSGELGPIVPHDNTTDRRAVMRARFVVLLGAIAVLGACDKSTTPVSPATTADDVVDLIPDYAVSPAASIDAAGIGGSLLPDALKLTAEQKAAITALHDAFMKATAADIAALQAIEQEAKTAIRAGKSRERDAGDSRQRRLPFVASLDAAFKKLQADIWAVYTPEQRAWIEAHRQSGIASADRFKLTDDQVKAIRDLEQQFYATVKPDLELIRSIVEEAKKAREAGKSREEVAAILARAIEPQRRVADAERKLQAAILARADAGPARDLWTCRRRIDSAVANEANAGGRASPAFLLTSPTVDTPRATPRGPCYLESSRPPVPSRRNRSERAVRGPAGKQWLVRHFSDDETCACSKRDRRRRPRRDRRRSRAAVHSRSR